MGRFLSDVSVRPLNVVLVCVSVEAQLQNKKRKSASLVSLLPHERSGAEKRGFFVPLHGIYLEGRAKYTTATEQLPLSKLIVDFKKMHNYWP